jgi:stringent starvation protein B
VKNGEIVLNISFDATSSLKLGNDFIEFKARFAGTAREISVPVGRVIAIYARENGQGMAFPAPAPSTAPAGAGSTSGDAPAARLPLRDASRGAEADPGKVVHLISGEGAAEDGTATTASTPPGPEEPPRPPGSGGSRPSLKRIK